MKTIQFKTNINCGACVSKVTPVLDKDDTIQKWNVDTEHPDKILTVEVTENAEEEDIVHALKKVGYKAEKL